MSEPTALPAAPPPRVPRLWFLPRFTVRRMMVAVAVAAAVLGTHVGLRRRAERLGRLAAAHADEARVAAAVAWGSQRFGINSDGTVPEDQAREAARSWRLYAHHKALGEKYERAARSPWLPVAPDPPEPQ